MPPPEYDKRTLEKMEKVREKLNEYEYYNEFFYYNQEAYLSKRIENMSLWNHFWMNRDIPHSTAYFFTTWHYMKEICKDMKPAYERGNATALYYDNCALAHINFARSDDINPKPHSVYNDHSDMTASKDLEDKLINVHDCIKLLGLVLYLMNFEVGFNKLVFILAIVNMGLCYFQLTEVSLEPGVDYIAYLQ